jgi:hypothetical protein
VRFVPLLTVTHKAYFCSHLHALQQFDVFTVSPWNPQGQGKFNVASQRCLLKLTPLTLSLIQLAKLRNELLVEQSGGGGGGGEGFDVARLGDARVALIGFPR